MRIILAENYVIDIDPLNYTLKKKYIGKDSSGNDKAAEKVCGYFGNVRECVEEFIRLAQIEKLKGMELSLEGYLERLEKENKRIADEIIRMMEEKI
ncbi:hypothetical protein B5F53_11570 [Blautia sp. An249]|uniref:hypothetical protein n=1 Tax=Blautia sp. An249 TaxID=1965603 RepID=UPI000B36CBB5|nr:hypothetical protein [Blautia sp. An249]OUO78179.1 hypothetical protein B5F53_11570 [Blautia sp. An249]